MTKVASLEIEMAANIARLQDDFARARKDVDSACSGIKRSVSEMKDAIKEKIDGVNESMRSMKEMMEAVGVAMLAEKMTEAAKTTAEYGEQVELASKKTGVSTQTLQGLAFAAKMVDLDFTTMSTGLEHLSRSLVLAQQGSLQTVSSFQSLGLSAAQIKNMSVEDVLKTLADKFHGTADGAAKTGIAMQLLGRAGADLIPLLDKGSAGLQQMMEKAQSLGIVMNKDSIEKSAEFADQLKVLSAEFEAVTRDMMGELMPSLTQIMHALLGASGDGDTLKSAMQELGYMVQWVAKIVDGVTTTVVGFGKTVAMVAAVIASPTHAKTIFSEWEKDIDDLTAKSAKFMETVSTPVKPEESAPESEPTKHLNIIQTTMQSNMPEYQAKLNAAKIYYQKTNDLREYSKQMEIKYWQDILARDNVNEKDRLAIQKRLSALRLQVMKQEATERRKLSEESINESRQTSLNEIALEEEKSNTLLQSGQITHDQMLKLRQVYENEKYQIEVHAQQQLIKLYTGDPNHDPVALKKQLDQLALIRQQHLLDMQKMQSQAAANLTKTWQNAFRPVSSAFDTTMKGIIMGTTTWQKGFNRILQSIVGEFIDAGVKMVTNWAANEMARTAATVAGTTTRMVAERSANSAGLVSSALTVVKAIMNDAAKAFSGVWAALSGIPYVGPVLAAAAAPAAMATVAGVAGSVASSAGGEWNVPVDRLQFVHKNETILPSGVADSWRSLVSQNMAGGGDSPIHIHGTRQSTFTGDQLVQMLGKLNRNFRFVTP